MKGFFVLIKIHKIIVQLFKSFSKVSAEIFNICLFAEIKIMPSAQRNLLNNKNIIIRL